VFIGVTPKHGNYSAHTTKKEKLKNGRGRANSREFLWSYSGTFATSCGRWAEEVFANLEAHRVGRTALSQGSGNGSAPPGASGRRLDARAGYPGTERYRLAIRFRRDIAGMEASAEYAGFASQMALPNHTETGVFESIVKTAGQNCGYQWRWWRNNRSKARRMTGSDGNTRDRLVCRTRAAGGNDHRHLTTQG